VSPAHRPPLPPQKVSWCSFLLEVESVSANFLKAHFNENNGNSGTRIGSVADMVSNMDVDWIQLAQDRV
jgi:hypothetical protein